MASFIFDSFRADLANGRLKLNDDTFKVMLLKAGFKAQKKTTARRSDLLTYEVTGKGYTIGGAVAKVSAKNGAGLEITLGEVEWTGSIKAAAGVYYKAGGAGAARDELVALVDFGKEIVSTNGLFSLSGSRLVISS